MDTQMLKICRLFWFKQKISFKIKTFQIDSNYHLDISQGCLRDEVVFVRVWKGMSASEESADADLADQVRGWDRGLADVDEQSFLGGLQIGLGHVGGTESGSDGLNDLKSSISFY